MQDAMELNTVVKKCEGTDWFKQNHFRENVYTHVKR